MGSPAPLRWYCLVALLMPPCPLTALVHLCTRRDAEPALGSATGQRSKAWCQDEGHGPKHGLEPSGQGTKGYPKPGCPIPQEADIPQGEVGCCCTSTPGGEQRRPKERSERGGAGAAPRCPARPRRSRGAQQWLINHSAPRRDGGPADRRQSPRRYHRNNPHPAQASKGFVRVPVCAAPSPPSPCCFLCACTQERVGFFSSFLGSIWHRGSDHVKSEIRVDGWTDEPGEPATIVQRLGSLLKGEGEGLWGMEAAVVLTRQK